MRPTVASGTLFYTSAVIGLAERQSPTLVDVVKDLGKPLTRSITVYGELAASPGDAFDVVIAD